MRHYWRFAIVFGSKTHLMATINSFQYNNNTSNWISRWNIRWVECNYPNRPIWAIQVCWEPWVVTHMLSRAEALASVDFTASVPKTLRLKLAPACLHKLVCIACRHALRDKSATYWITSTTFCSTMVAFGGLPRQYGAQQCLAYAQWLKEIETGEGALTIPAKEELELWATAAYPNQGTGTPLWFQQRNGACAHHLLNYPFSAPLLYPLLVL